MPPSLGAQPIADEVRRAEQRRVEAARTGRGMSALLADDYFDIIPPGTTRTAKDVATITPNPRAGENPDIQVRMFGDAALVTGTVSGPGGEPNRDRYLRVWLRQNGSWKAVAYHGTWIGTRPDARPPLPPTPPSAGFTPTTDAEKAIWMVHQQVEQASAASDRDTYRKLLADDFVRVTADGQTYNAQQWVSRFPGTKRPPAVQSEVRLRTFGELAVMTYRNHAPPRPGQEPTLELMTRIFVRQGSDWKLLLTQSTTARRPQN
jgi:ketosteroid isomerase-like protein